MDQSCKIIESFLVNRPVLAVSVSISPLIVSHPRVDIGADVTVMIPWVPDSL